jgi:DNA-directed RNA polymerase specialized sigma24 family protein
MSLHTIPHATYAARSADDRVHRSSSEALEEFVRAGWHLEVERRLTFRYGRACGSAAIEEALGHALERAATQLEAHRGRQVYAFVLTAAERWLLDNFKGARRAQARGWARRVDPSLAEERDSAVEPSAEEAWVERDGDAIREEIVNELLHRLETGDRMSTISERVRLVMLLFHGEHLTKREIRARTGLTPKQLRSALSDGNRFLHDEYLAAESRFDHGDCGEVATSVTRLVFNIARGHEAQRARAHVRHCFSCAQLSQRAEAARHAFGLLLPLPPVVAEIPGTRTSLVDPLVALAGRVKTAVTRCFADGADSVQAAAIGGVGRGAASPAAALAAKLAAACLATGGIAAACVGTGVLSSPTPRHPRHAVAGRSAGPRPPARTAASPAASRMLNAAQTSVRSTSGRPSAGHARRRKRRTTRANPQEFFTPTAQPSSVSEAPTSTAATSVPTPSAKPEPPEFPIF